MINALMLIAGAVVFAAGFLIGLHFDYPPYQKAEETGFAAGGVVENKEFKSFLSYDGTEQY